MSKIDTRLKQQWEDYCNVMSRPNLWGMSPFPAATSGLACYLAGIPGFRRKVASGSAAFEKDAPISLHTSRGLPTRGGLFGIGTGLLASAYVSGVLDDEVNGSSMATGKCFSLKGA